MNDAATTVTSPVSTFPKPKATVPLLLYVAAGIQVLVAGAIFGGARTVLHEVVALLIGLNASLTFLGAAVMHSILGLRYELWRYHGGIEPPDAALRASAPLTETDAPLSPHERARAAMQQARSATPRS